MKLFSLTQYQNFWRLCVFIDYDMLDRVQSLVSDVEINLD